MTEMLPVFINDRLVRLAAGGTVADAVAACEDETARQFRAGAATVTDGRGIRLAPDTPIHAGAILRVIVTARRARDEADADP